MRCLLLVLPISVALAGCTEPPQERTSWKEPEIPARSEPPRPEDEPVPEPPPGGEPAASATISSADAPPVALPVRSIQGAWTLAAIDGSDLPPGQRIVVDIGRHRIEFDNCQQVAWGYSLEDGRLATRRVPAITIDIRPKPLPCAAPFAPQVERMVAILDTATRVDPFGGGRIVVKAGAGRLVLSTR